MAPKLDLIITKPSRNWPNAFQLSVDHNKLASDLGRLTSKEHKDACFTYYVGNKSYFSLCNHGNQNQIIKLADFSNPHHRVLLLELAGSSEELTCQIVKNLSFSPKPGETAASPDIKLDDTKLSMEAVNKKNLFIETKELKQEIKTVELKGIRAESENKVWNSLSSSTSSSSASSSLPTPRATPTTIHEQYKAEIIDRLKELTESNLVLSGRTPSKNSRAAEIDVLIELWPISSVVQWAKEDRELAIIIFANFSFFFRRYLPIIGRLDFLIQIYKQWSQPVEDLQLAVLAIECFREIKNPITIPSDCPGLQNLRSWVRGKNYFLPDFMPAECPDHPNLQYLVFGDQRHPHPEFLQAIILNAIKTINFNFKFCNYRSNLRMLSLMIKQITLKIPEEHTLQTTIILEQSSKCISPEKWKIMTEGFSTDNFMSLIRTRAPDNDPQQLEFAVKLLFIEEDDSGITSHNRELYLAVTKYLGIRNIDSTIIKIWWERTEKISQRYFEALREKPVLMADIFLLPPFFITQFGITLPETLKILRDQQLNLPHYEGVVRCTLWTAIKKHMEENAPVRSNLFQRSPLFFMAYHWPEASTTAREQYVARLLLGLDVATHPEKIDSKHENSSAKRIVDDYHEHYPSCDPIARYAAGAPTFFTALITVTERAYITPKIQKTIVEFAAKIVAAHSLFLLPQELFVLVNSRIFPNHLSVLTLTHQSGKNAFCFFQHGNREKTVWDLIRNTIIAVTCQQMTTAPAIENTPEMLRAAVGAFSNFLSVSDDFKILYGSLFTEMEAFLPYLPIEIIIEQINDYLPLIKQFPVLKNKVLTKREELITTLVTAAKPAQEVEEKEEKRSVLAQTETANVSAIRTLLTWDIIDLFSSPKCAVTTSLSSTRAGNTSLVAHLGIYARTEIYSYNRNARSLQKTTNIIGHIFRELIEPRFTKNALSSQLDTRLWRASNEQLRRNLVIALAEIEFFPSFVIAYYRRIITCKDQLPTVMPKHLAALILDYEDGSIDSIIWLSQNHPKQIIDSITRIPILFCLSILALGFHETEHAFTRKLLLIALVSHRKKNEFLVDPVITTIFYDILLNDPTLLSDSDLQWSFEQLSSFNSDQQSQSQSTKQLNLFTTEQLGHFWCTPHQNNTKIRSIIMQLYESSWKTNVTSPAFLSTYFHAIATFIAPPSSLPTPNPFPGTVMSSAEEMFYLNVLDHEIFETIKQLDADITNTKKYEPTQNLHYYTHKTSLVLILLNNKNSRLVRFMSEDKSEFSNRPFILAILWQLHNEPSKTLPKKPSNAQLAISRTIPKYLIEDIFSGKYNSLLEDPLRISLFRALLELGFIYSEYVNSHFDPIRTMQQVHFNIGKMSNLYGNMQKDYEQKLHSPTSEVFNGAGTSPLGATPFPVVTSSSLSSVPVPAKTQTIPLAVVSPTPIQPPRL